MTIVAQALDNLPVKDYDWLRANIAKWLKRTDMTDEIPDLIVMAEAKLSEDLQAREMDAKATLTLVAAEPYLDLPDDFRNLRSLSIPDQWYTRPEYHTPQELEAKFDPASPSRPLAYTIIGRQLWFAPVPDAPYPVEIIYERRIPALSDTNATNWLLQRSPNAYLWCALMIAQTFIFNDARTSVFQQWYADAIGAINATDWHTGGAMRVRTDTRNC